MGKYSFPCCYFCCSLLWYAIHHFIHTCKPLQETTKLYAYCCNMYYYYRRVLTCSSSRCRRIYVSFFGLYCISESRLHFVLFFVSLHKRANKFSFSRPICCKHVCGMPAMFSAICTFCVYVKHETGT